MYVMLKAIPDANQTFREITFDVITKRVENDIQPRVFFEDFPGWVLYARDEPTTGGGWKDVLVANTSKPDATSSISPHAAGWSSTARNAGSTRPDERHPVLRRASRGRPRPTASPATSRWP